jgi:hypothetical protein
VVKMKKDILGQKLYTSLKKHPFVKNPVALFYLVPVILLAITYVIYLIYKI